MSYLKSLNLIVAPINGNLSPKLKRRQHLIERLEQQRKLVQNPDYTVVIRRMVKDLSGVKKPIDIQKQIKPWWRKDTNGNVYLTLKCGLKTLVLDKGMTAIAVGTIDKLDGVLNTLISAAKAGELDNFIEQSVK
jgi:hypothetical protein